MQIILSVSIAVLAGLLMTRVVKSLKLPDVTAYLIAGIFVGPYFLGSLGIDGLGFISMESVDLMTLVSQVALGFIAFAIGNEFRLEEITHIGRQAVVVGVFQGLAAMLCVDTALLLLHILIPDKLSVAQAITLGAISTATAPAATLMVVRQYKASGPLTDLLLPVVALDDAVGLVAFAISFGIARTLSSGVVDFVSILADPLIEIVASLLLGAISGWLLTQLPVWLIALFAGLIVATIMSTISSAAQSVVVNITHDIYQQLHPEVSSQKALKLSRLLSVLVMAVACVLAILFPHVLTVLVTTYAYSAAGLAAPMYLGYALRKKNKVTTMGLRASMICGILGCILSTLLKSTIPYVIWGILASVVALFLVSALTKGSAKVLDE